MKPISEETTDLILAAAKKEFMEYGFLDASLRRISSECNVSTHTIYTRFGDKEGLFEVLVGNAANGLYETIKKLSDGVQQISEASVSQDMDSVQGSMDVVLDYIYRDKDLFKLIFCKSAGTKYEHYLDNLSKMESDSYKKLFSSSKDIKVDADDFFIEVICASGYRELAEILIHDLSYEDAKIFMNRDTRFSMAGWKGLMI